MLLQLLSFTLLPMRKWKHVLLEEGNLESESQFMASFASLFTLLVMVTEVISKAKTAHLKTSCNYFSLSVFFIPRVPNAPRQEQAGQSCAQVALGRREHEQRSGTQD